MRTLKWWTLSEASTCRRLWFPCCSQIISDLAIISYNKLQTLKWSTLSKASICRRLWFRCCSRWTRWWPRTGRQSKGRRHELRLWWQATFWRLKYVNQSKINYYYYIINFIRLGHFGNYNILNKISSEFLLNIINKDRHFEGWNIKTKVRSKLLLNT
jgi:hypothetical protein